MLRVGLTGELGSGKSTVARLLAGHGALVLSSDEMARALMQPGEPVFQAILDHFGAAVLRPDGNLDRRALAALAFDPAHPRVEELNALIHPAVLAAQEDRLAEIARDDPDAIVVIESALIFSTKHAGKQPWRTRFDRILLVTAPDAVKIERFLARSAAGKPLTAAECLALRTDAQRRLEAQRIPASVSQDCIVIANTGDLNRLEQEVAALWPKLVEATRSEHRTNS